jgi:hypothetical protein
MDIIVQSHLFKDEQPDHGSSVLVSRGGHPEILRLFRDGYWYDRQMVFRGAAKPLDTWVYLSDIFASDAG